MELLGERWSLLIVRELLLGGRRFTDLRAGLPGISARVLAERLEGLEGTGIVRRRELPPPLGARLYELTPWGLAAQEAVLALCRWALQGPARDLALPLSPAALALSLRALFRGEREEGDAIEAVLRIGSDRFTVTIAGKRIALVRGEGVAPAFTLESADTTALKRLIYGKAPLGALADAGLIFEGDANALARFVDCFALPAPVG